MEVVSLSMRVNVMRSDLHLPQILAKSSLESAIADSPEQPENPVKETVTVVKSLSAQTTVDNQKVFQAVILPEVQLSSTTDILKDCSSPLPGPIPSIPTC